MIELVIALERAAIALKLLGMTRTHWDWTHASCWWVCRGKLLHPWHWDSMRIAQHAWLVARVSSTCSDMVHRGPDCLSIFVICLLVVAVNEVNSGCKRLVRTVGVGACGICLGRLDRHPGC